MRKSIHILSIFLPIMYRYIFHNEQKPTLLFFLFLIIVSIVVELFRLENKNFGRYFMLIFGVLLRKHEKNNITGASYLLVSAIICVAFFPADIAFVAMAFLSIGDTFAALVGMNFGKRKFINSSKTFEGTLACFITTFVFGLFFIDPLIALWGAFTASVAELVNIPFDDNVKIPILSGIVMWITYLVLNDELINAAKFFVEMKLWG
ncbi:MAG: phosphatidate cytidylyltransferase [Candidatus Cloacimonetes bacterium]|nr:phosphatidate cytidylyltransferase [Candidatus Cloacimonadota bacterium]